VHAQRVADSDLVMVRTSGPTYLELAPVLAAASGALARRERGDWAVAAELVGDLRVMALRRRRRPVRLIGLAGGEHEQGAGEEVADGERAGTHEGCLREVRGKITR
jgi:hypothetical protein